MKEDNIIMPLSILDARSKFDIKQEVDRKEFWELCREVDQGLYTLASMIEIEEILGELNSKLETFEIKVKNAISHTEGENVREGRRFEPQFIADIDDYEISGKLGGKNHSDGSRP